MQRALSNTLMSAHSLPAGCSEDGDEVHAGTQQPFPAALLLSQTKTTQGQNASLGKTVQPDIADTRLEYNNRRWKQEVCTAQRSAEGQHCVLGHVS